MKEKIADIDILEEKEKKAINNLNFIVVTDIYDNEVRIDKTKIINEYNESVGIVLSLIDKIIAENKELKEDNEYLKNQIPIDKIFYYSYKEFIPKSKVEEEIDKLNKKEKDLQNSINDEEREEYSDANISFDLMDIDIRRETLQSLLGKE